MNELLNELLTLIDQNVIRLQPYTLDDLERPAIQARIDDWTRRARLNIAARMTLTATMDAIDPQHCYLCDRPNLDCACTLEESESPV